MKRKLATLVLGAVGVLALGACGNQTKEYDGTEVQGVTESEILVGNTAATTGDFAQVGVPFNAGLEAVFKDYENNGGKKITLKHYDDGFDGARGATLTKKLVEDDKVFALVGHFGTNTVASTVDYIKEVGVPMVYAATGINDLYQEEAVGYDKAVISVQPIYKTEGRSLLARALAPYNAEAALDPTQQHGVNIYGDDVKIGVINTADDAGRGIREGVERQAEELKVTNITYSETQATAGTNHASAVEKLKNAGCQIVIVCANQVPFGEILKAMKNANYDAIVLTSYVSANAVTLGQLVADGSITATRPVYTAGWLDITTAEGTAALLDFVRVITTVIPEYAVYAANSYAMAGYVAGKLFVEGVQRVEDAGEELTWLNYINALESEKVSIPMGGMLDLSDGKRLGIEDLALNGTLLVETEVNGTVYPAGSLVSYASLQSIDTIWESVSSNLKK